MAIRLKSVKKAVIPAAGYGTRFLPITKVVPKELLPIGNKPAIQYVVEEAVASGIEEIILVCSPSKVGIIDYFRPNSGVRSFLEKKGKKEELAEIERIELLADFRVVYQREPRGLGHAVWCARKEIGEEPFLVMLPDVLIKEESPSIRALMGTSLQSEWGLLLEHLTPGEILSYGVIRGEKIRERVYEITGAVEKPSYAEAPSNLGILGRYLLPPEILPILNDLRGGVLGEIQLTDAINTLAGRKPGRGILTAGEIFDIGTPEGFREANNYFLDAMPSRDRRHGRAGR